MADSLPKLRVTSPHNTTTSPVPSPTFNTQSNGVTSQENLAPSHSNDQKSISQTPSRADTSSPTKSITNKDIGDAEIIPSAIDPLSQHILKRTKTGTPIADKLRSPTRDSGSRPGTPAPDGTPELKRSGESPRVDSFGTNKEKKKGVSFLSRFMGGNKKKAGPEPSIDNESEPGDVERPEGNEAEIFTQPIDNLGFSPKHPQPPAYIKVRARYKKEKEFDRVFLAQELRSRGTSKRKSMGPNGSSKRESDEVAGGSPVWALEFSRDGKYLAAGGQDKVLRIWATLSSPEERRSHEKEEAEAGQTQHLSAPVFQKKAMREYEGHTSTILDLSWSKNNFLLSSSMDKTVRLWHVSRPECLCTFKHTDFVPSIQFHPRDDRFFLAGSLDTKLRLWSIPDKNVAYSAQLPDMITAVSFTPDGKTAIAGTLNGLCQFYETEGLKYQTQTHVKSTHGKNAKGSKITGIKTLDTTTGDTKILITSNDSRIRLYNLRDKNLEVKFKGHANMQSQIRASFSHDAHYIISGSEDRKTYIFSTSASENEKKNQHPVEMFEAHSTITTCSIMAPPSTRILLSRSEDPVFDLCNPPPVTLVSKSESESLADTRHADTPDLTSHDLDSTATPSESAPTLSRTAPSPSPAYIARSAHSAGNIIVTADYSGSIKVFRQDCAFAKRRNDAWETGSTFSRKMGGASRTMSIATRGSGRSRRDSIGSNSTAAHGQDRILSWRKDVLRPSDSVDSLAGRPHAAARGKNRSVSPRKSLGAAGAMARKRAEASTPELGTNSPVERERSHGDAGEHQEKNGDLFNSEVNPMWLREKQSWGFWNTQMYKTQMDRAHAQQHDHADQDGAQRELRPPLSQQASTVSALSDERSVSADGDEEKGKKGWRR